MVWFFGQAVSSWLLADSCHVNEATYQCCCVCAPLSIRGHINRFNFSLWPAVLNAYYVSLTITIKHINAKAVKRCSSDYCCFSANFMTLIFCCCCYVVHHYLEILRGLAFAKSLCAFVCVADFLSLTLGIVPLSVPLYQSHLRSCLATCCATICHLTCAHVFEKLAVHTVFYYTRCFILSLSLSVLFIFFPLSLSDCEKLKETVFMCAAIITICLLEMKNCTHLLVLP